ncbi:hypothetical protein AYO40_00170 [Planctomycetaceae bacterium SCGC AG-212-D15]|nr:hypothetical protein AYO40_00170 [Planctomycetaceae bacterium SCGC AG-212-D15]
MKRFTSGAIAALAVVLVGSLGASTALAQGHYIPGAKYDYLINGLRSPGSTYGPSYYAPAQSPYQSGYFFGSREAEVAPDAALIRMQVPANAEVWFSGEKTEQRGQSREFVTPALDSGRRYAYRIKVRWLDDAGKSVEREQRVPVRPGDRLNLRFN